MKEDLYYNPTTGIFTWLKGRNKGKEAAKAYNKAALERYGF